jgi:hypothetical protein
MTGLRGGVYARALSPERTLRPEGFPEHPSCEWQHVILFALHRAGIPPLQKSCTKTIHSHLLKGAWVTVGGGGVVVIGTFFLALFVLAQTPSYYGFVWTVLSPLLFPDHT